MELIIVIAIMAVLVGILAPSFVRHIDKSKRVTDIQNTQEYLSAIRTYAITNDELKDGTITLTKDNAADVTPADSNLKEALASSGFKLDEMKLSSSTWGDDVVITVTVGRDNIPTFSVKQDGNTRGNDAEYDFAERLGLPKTT